MAFLRVYDALPVDMKNVSLPVLSLLDNLQDENAGELANRLNHLLDKFEQLLPPEDVTFINQALDWLDTTDPDMLCELVEEL